MDYLCNYDINIFNKFYPFLFEKNLIQKLHTMSFLMEMLWFLSIVL